MNPKQMISRRQLLTSTALACAGMFFAACNQSTPIPLTTTPSGTPPPLPNTAAPSPSPTNTMMVTTSPISTATLQPTATKEVMVINEKSLSVRSKEDLGEGLIEFNPEGAAAYYKDLWKAFLNPDSKNPNYAYLNKYFLGSLGHYDTFIKQLDAVNGEMPEGFIIPEARSGSHLVDNFLGSFNASTVFARVFTVHQTMERLGYLFADPNFKGLPENDPERISLNDFVNYTTPSCLLFKFGTLTADNGNIYLSLTLASYERLDKPNYKIFNYMDSLTPDTVKILGNELGFFPIMVKYMSKQKAYTGFNDNVPYVVVGCIDMPHDFRVNGNCGSMLQDENDPYSTHEKDPAKMHNPDLFIVVESDN